MFHKVSNETTSAYGVALTELVQANDFNTVLLNIETKGLSSYTPSNGGTLYILDESDNEINSYTIPNTTTVTKYIFSAPISTNFKIKLNIVSTEVIIKSAILLK